MQSRTGGDLMCTYCGCGQSGGHRHGHDHTLDEGARRIKIEMDILSRNNTFAASNRDYFMQHSILALNLVSSPGSGKTTLLVRTIEALGLPAAVIEGDQQTSLDAERIRQAGVPVQQVNTGKGCHLDAHMVEHAVGALASAAPGVLFIENVGNLVCPAAFDLGEAHKVVILSVTEGEDKPLKYPDMFHASDLMIINKTDLAPYVDFNDGRCVEYARRINPDIEVLQLSATIGDGIEAWIEWIRNRAANAVETAKQAAG